MHDVTRYLSFILIINMSRQVCLHHKKYNNNDGNSNHFASRFILVCFIMSLDSKNNM
jgi:hypothetical protein